MRRRCNNRIILMLEYKIITNQCNIDIHAFTSRNFALPHFCNGIDVILFYGTKGKGPSIDLRMILEVVLITAHLKF